MDTSLLDFDLWPNRWSISEMEVTYFSPDQYP